MRRPPALARFVAKMILLFIAANAAAETATIELLDGSTLKGEVLSLKAGAYQVKTPSLGVIQIPQSDVALVRYEPAVSNPTAAVDAPPSRAGAEAMLDGNALAALQAQLSQNPQTLALIMSLGQDPVVQSILHDPEIRAAIAAGNLQPLLQHPKIQQLMAHPTVRAITKNTAQ